MERLIEYVTHHPLLVGAAVLALVVVLTYESRMRATAFASISSQDLVIGGTTCQIPDILGRC